MNSMMIVMLVAGIGLLLAGLVAIGFGIQIKEFSFGNTLILAGAVAACTGMLLIGLWVAVRELKEYCAAVSAPADGRSRPRRPASPPCCSAG